MNLDIFENYAELSDKASDRMIRQLIDNPFSLFCLATGDTPRLTYEMFVDKVKTRGIDSSGMFLIGLDEWIGVRPQTSGACCRYLRECIIGPLSLDDSRVLLFDGVAVSELNECSKMNALIEEKGGIDFTVAGIGMNGHIGFNEPGTSPNAVAHVTVLDELTRRVGQKYFSDMVRLMTGITVGLKQVMESRQLIVMANGERKAPVIKRMLGEKINERFPASLIRNHPTAMLMIDREAARLLENGVV